MLSDDEILNYITQELQSASGGDDSDAIQADREKALSYYLGQPNGREQEGRSAVTSTDVADAIEWIKPQIVKAFTQNSEVVRFDPTSEADEDQAEMESDYVHDCLMKKNNGFIAIHEFIQDCLIQKNGIFKVYYDDDVSEEVERYTGIDQQQLMMLTSSPDVEVMEMTQEIDQATGQLAADVKIKRTTDNGQVRAICIPPEEFRVNRQHNSIDLQDARFTCHTVSKTRSELIEAGYDKALVESIPVNDLDDDTDQRFYAQNETVMGGSVSADPSQQTVEVSECYLKIDIDEDGIAELMQIKVAGGSQATHLLEMTEVDEAPFFSSSAILMSHKFFGLSVFDRLKEIQDQKTALWRNMLDNLYLQNNGKTEVVDGQVNLDDLLVSRPGGIVRVRAPGMVREIKAPPIGNDAYQMMTYLDEVRAGRAGVSPEGAAQNYKIGSDTAHGVERLMTAKEELVGLMIRVIAETGIKPMCVRIRNLLRKHVDAMTEYRHKGQWQQVNPAQWMERSNTTVRVGTGTGNEQKQAMAIQFVLQMQEKISMNPEQSIVDDGKVFAALHDAAKFMGLEGARKYFVDPESPQGQQLKGETEQKGQGAQQQQQQQMQAMAQAQIKLAEAEQMKAQADMQAVQVKSQTETVKAENDRIKTELQAAKSQHDIAIEQIKLKLIDAENRASSAAKDAEIEFKYAQLNEKTANELTKMELEAGMELNRQQEANNPQISGAE